LGREIIQNKSPALADIIRPTNATTYKEMRPSLALQAHRQAIREIALRHRVSNVRVFGSALHGDDTEDSDLDLLVEPTAETTLMDIAKIQVEVARLLNVGVDVLTPNALPDKFRAQVMAEALAV
jgi:predicted nucleotidyltransferase